MPTLLIIAGETSGDIHGANLARSLRKQNPDIRLVGTGGDRMREAGVRRTGEAKTGDRTCAMRTAGEQTSAKRTPHACQPAEVER